MKIKKEFDMLKWEEKGNNKVKISWLGEGGDREMVGCRTHIGRG